MFGRNDALDAIVLGFLGVSDDDVLAVIAQEPDSDQACLEIIRRSGKSPEECRNFSTFMSTNLDFGFKMLETDEGRHPGGFDTSFMLFVYRHLVLPYGSDEFAKAEAMRAAPSPVAVS
jgi:hypothetical protein